MILRIFKSDPLLAAVTALLALSVCWPLTVTPFVPLHDLPDHVGLAAMMGDIFFGQGLAAEHYRIQWLPVPYWGTYAFIALFSPLVGARFAAKLLVGLTLISLPLGAMRLLVALKRSPRLGLLAFLLCWDHNLSWGFVAYVLGLGLGLFALAHLVEAETPKAALKKWPWVVAVALTHAHAFGIFVVAAFFLSFGTDRLVQRLKVHAAGAATGVGILIPWVLGRALFGGAHESGGSKGTEWHALSDKVKNMLTYSLDAFPGEWADQGSAAAFVIFMVGLLTLSALRMEKRIPETRGTVSLFVAALALYFFLPMTIYWPIEQWYIYPRQATVLLLFAIFVPRPNLEGKRALALLPVVATALYAHAAVTSAFSDFAKRAGPFEEIIEAMPEDKALLTLTLDDNDPAIRLGPYNQFHAYVVAQKGGYDPYLFDNPSHPVVHRPEKKRPHPPWNRMNTFSLERHGIHYDYVLVQGTKRDPLAKTGKDKVEMVKEAGRWRLYRIKAPPP